MLALLTAGVVLLRPHDGARTRERHQAQPQRVAGASRSAEPAPRPVPATVSTRLSDGAAQGFDRDFFTSSPGGVLATAARVARWRALVGRATRGSGIGPSLVEAIVFVESSGRPDALGARGAAGLTQLRPSVGRHLLHLRVNTVRSGALTRRIMRADARGARTTARQLRRWRARYDQRFSPAVELRATVRYLALARRELGRDDLAVAAYELGIGSVRNLTGPFGEEAPSYAQLYFGSAPDVHRGTWLRLASSGGYTWKVLAARRIMRLYRRDPAALVFEQRQQERKNSAEEVLHPRYRTPRFTSPGAIARAWRRHVLRAIPRDARRTHIAVGPFVGAEAYKLGRSRRLYRGVRAATLDVLLYIGGRVHELSHSSKPLILTSAVRDNRYQRVLMNVNANAARTYSIHTTGYAFDVARVYSGRRQAAAFQFVLDRLQAVDAIAYIREATAIHVAVASDAAQKLALLARAST